MTISEAPRHIRRAAYAQERAERMSGQWSPWRQAASPELDELRRNAAGWLRDVHSAWTNGWCCVMVRTIRNTTLGVTVDHAALRTALQDEPGWKEKQRIKDEIFGNDRMAIEVYPRRYELIDAADMYHLWVFPAGFRFDFGLGEGQK